MKSFEAKPGRPGRTFCIPGQKAPQQFRCEAFCVWMGDHMVCSYRRMMSFTLV